MFHRDRKADASRLCLDAVRAVMGDRQTDYGRPRENWTRIAGMWSALLGVEITPAQAALMMVLVKVSREWNRRKRDNLVDIIGQCLVAQDCYEEE